MPPLLERPQRRAPAPGADIGTPARDVVTTKRAHSSSSEPEPIPLPEPGFVPRSLLAGTPVQIQAPSRALAPRQQQASTSAIIPAGYPALNSSPDAGTVVGIVLGSVGGFLIFFWLLWSCMNFGTPPGRSVGDAESSWGGSSTIISRRSRRSHNHNHHHHHHRHSSHGRRETVEIRSSRGAVPIIVEPERPGGGERIRIVEEVRTSSAGPGRRSADEDEIVVEEDRSTPPRRSKSNRRSSTYREEVRRSGGSGRRRPS